jgi:hypothetical protein
MLDIQYKNSQRRSWRRLGELSSFDRPMTFSNNTDNCREVFVLKCEPDGKSSVVLKTGEGLDIPRGYIEDISQTGLHEIARLTQEGTPLELTVKPDQFSGHEVTLRLTHKER